METPNIDLLNKACADPGRFVARRFFPRHAAPGTATVAEELYRWQARAVQAAIRGLASEEYKEGTLSITRPLRVRVIAADMNGQDLFGTGEIILEPGNSIQWQYPATGIEIETDLPVRVTP